MTDIATLGLALDSRPIVDGTNALDNLGEAAVRVEQKVRGANGQMNDTSAFMRAAAEAARVAEESNNKFLVSLQREIDLFGANRAETERYNAEMAGMSTSTQRAAQALGAKIDAMHRDEAAARELAAAEDRVAQAGDRFIKSLNDQVATLGMTTAQLHSYRAAQLGVSDAAAPLITKLSEAGAGARSAGGHIDGLSFASVGARRELLVLAHELSQGNFQKFGGSMMVLGEQTGAAGLLFSATGLAALGLVAALGGLAYANIKGALEQKHMNDALIMTGNYAGETADGLNELAHAAVTAGGSIGEAKKVVTELAGSGKFTGEQIGYITEATVAWEHATGQSIKSIIKDFESLAVQTTGNTMRATEAISRATIKLDDQYHFLTEAVYEQIRALEKEGDAKGASALATETFAKVTHDRAEEIIGNLGTIARGWNAIKEAIGGAIDQAGNWGKKATPASEVARLTAALHTPDMLPGVYNKRTRDEAVALATQQLAHAQTELNAVNAAAEAQGKTALAQSEAVHAASRIAADDARLQKKEIGELQAALRQYADDVAKVKAVNPTSALVSDEAVAAHIAAIKKAHTAHVKGNDDRAKLLQDALVIEQTALDREKSVYDSRDKMLQLYHSKFGMSDADFYAAREAARAEYIASEAIAFAKEAALIKSFQAKNPEEIAANKTKYDELLKQHLKFVDDMRNAGGDDAANAAAATKKQYDDIVKATVDAGAASIKSLNDQIEKQKEHNAEIGKTKSQIELAKQAQIELATAQLQSDADYLRDGLAKWQLDDQSSAVFAIRLHNLDEEIERRKTIAGILASGAVLEADAKAAAEATKAWKRTANTIENDLTNAILDGGGRGWRKLVRDMEFAFARMVLQPIMQPISSSVASMAYPLAAQAGSVGGSATGSAIGSATGSLFGFGSSMSAVGGTIATGFMNTMAGTGVSAGLNAAGAMIANGAWAQGLGMAAGALGPIALGIGAVVALAKALDHSGTPHIGGAASASSAGVSTIRAEDLHFEKTQTSADAEKMTAALASGIVGILDSTALAFGKTAGYTAATAFADDSSKDGAWGGLVISKLGEKLVDWQDARGNGPWAPKVFADGAEGQKQYLAAISADVRTALNGIGLPDWAQKMLDGLGNAPAIEDLAKVVDSINATQTALKAMGDHLVGFSNLSESAVSALMAAAGGIQNLATGASAYYDGFYSDAEKSANSIKQIGDVLASVGLAMPDTNEGFRALVEQQMALGETAAPAVAALFNVAGAFEKLHPLVVATTTALQDQAQAYRDAATGLLGNVDSAFSVFESVVTREKSALQSRIDAEMEAVGKLKSLSDSLHGTLDAMRAPGQEAADRASAQAQIKVMLAIAKAGGPLPTADSLKQSLSTVSKDASSLFATYQDYQRDFYSTQNDISDLAKFSDDALSVEEKSLKSLQDQAKALDDILEREREQVNILKGIDTNGLTLIQAVEGVRTAILGAMSNPVNAALSPINQAYQTALGRAPDNAGLDFWKQKASEGVPISDIVGAINNSPEASIQKLYKDLLGRSADAGGLDFFMHSGASIDAIRQAMMGSDEYKKLHQIPGFASGGFFDGGLRLVGERGPELEATGPSRIWNAQQTRSMLGSGDSGALVAEIKALRDEVKGLRAEARATAGHTEKTARQLSRVIREDKLITGTEVDA